MEMQLKMLRNVQSTLKALSSEIQDTNAAEATGAAAYKVGQAIERLMELSPQTKDRRSDFDDNTLIEVHFTGVGIKSRTVTIILQHLNDMLKHDYNVAYTHALVTFPSPSYPPEMYTRVVPGGAWFKLFIDPTTAYGRRDS